ncbi:ERF superfamily protein [Micromonospora nigra]|uniref:ERF superfamily protein n=1 Tax=Micromonospora nigra TaxID=145857 RepID=A0A1C6SRS3_9ACTN|nr:ERF family protein [Micromonospora nigra]SCL32177.1 ERF superfamily protein [Micromonospora nigra]
MGEQHESLSEALAAFQVDPPVLTKNRDGQVGNQRTKYADLVQVNKQVLARLNELGIIYTTAPTLLDDNRFVLQYELLHVPSGEKMGGRYPLKLSENPQQMGSAISYARRYVLLALTGVAAEDEDDDGQAASGRRYAQRAQQPRQQAGPGEGRPAAQRAQRSSRPGPALPGEQAPAAGGISEAQSRKLHACLREAGITTRDEGLLYIAEVVGSPVESTAQLSKSQAARVIDALERFIAQQEPPAGGEDR